MGGTSFYEAQFHLGMLEGHQQVPGLLGSGHLASSFEGRRENLTKAGEGRRQGRNRCLKGVDQRSVIYRGACCLRFSALPSFSGVQTSTTARSPDSSEGSRRVYVCMCTEVPLCAAVCTCWVPAAVVALPRCVIADPPSFDGALGSPGVIGLM